MRPAEARLPCPVTALCPEAHFSRGWSARLNICPLLLKLTDICKTHRSFAAHLFMDIPLSSAGTCYGFPLAPASPGASPCPVLVLCRALQDPQLPPPPRGPTVLPSHEVSPLRAPSHPGTRQHPKPACWWATGTEPQQTQKSSSHLPSPQPQFSLEHCPTPPAPRTTAVGAQDLARPRQCWQPWSPRWPCPATREGTAAETSRGCPREHQPCPVNLTPGIARGAAEQRRTENAERNSGPFPFVQVRREQKGDASAPHAAEIQPPLTPTTRIQQPIGASGALPWHPAVRGARPDGRPAAPGLPALTSPPSAGVTTRRVLLLFYQFCFSVCFAFPSPQHQLCPEIRLRSLLLSLKLQPL